MKRQTIRALGALLVAGLVGCATGPEKVAVHEDPAREGVAAVGTVRLALREADGTLVRAWTVHNLVVNTGLACIKDDVEDGTCDLSGFDYVGFGSDAGAILATDTGPQTEATTQYNPDNTRPTCSWAQGGSAYETVCSVTFTPDGAFTVENIFLMDNATVGSGSAYSGVLTGTSDLDGAGQFLDVDWTISWADDGV